MFTNTVFKDISFPEIVQEAGLKGIPDFINAEDDALHTPAKIIAKAFKADQKFLDLLENAKDDITVIESFQKNVRLLVQKTWTEKEDEEFKEETVYRIDTLCKTLLTDNSNLRYAPVFAECFSILDDVVFLLFGTNAKQPDFLDYAVRIDPDFGLFCYYISSISKLENLSEKKARLSVLNAIYFLANF
ncbi:MAG: hypothetical protein CR988_06350 [Treponema sp.]|nr:MAG: hypothetical protein CR988_06350 [Treponema sp.]